MTLTVPTTVSVEVEEVLQHMTDAMLLDEVVERGLSRPVLDLERVIEPFLPDSLEHPARWLAIDIASAIRAAGKKQMLAVA